MKLPFNFKIRKRCPSIDSQFPAEIKVPFNITKIKNHLQNTVETMDLPSAPNLENNYNEHEINFEDNVTLLYKEIDDTKIQNINLTKQLNKTIEQLNNATEIIANMQSEISTIKFDKKKKQIPDFQEFQLENEIDPASHKQYISSLYNHNVSNASSISNDINFINQKNIEQKINIQEDDIGLNIPLLATRIQQEINKPTNAPSNIYQLLQTECQLYSNVNFVDYEKVANLVNKTKLAMPFDLDQLGSRRFFQCLPPSHFKKLSQQEYNLLVTQLMGSSTKAKLLNHKILPQQLTTEEFINEVYRLSDNAIQDELLIDRKIYEFSTNDTDILKILCEINDLIDQVPTNVWGESVKDRKLFFTIKKSLSDNFTPHLNNLITYNHIERKFNYPSREKIKEFIYKHSDIIEKELKRNRYNRRVNYIDDKEKERMEQILNSNDGKDDQFMNKYYKEDDVPKYPNKQNEHYKNNSNNYRSNYNRKSTFNANNYEKERPYENNNYQNKFNNRYNYQNNQQVKRCQFCNGISHNDDNCFFHPSKEIASKNQTARCQKCLLCSEINHLSFNCELYKDIRPIPLCCNYCKLNKKYNYHPAYECKFK